MFFLYESLQESYKRKETSHLEALKEMQEYWDAENEFTFGAVRSFQRLSSSLVYSRHPKIMFQWAPGSNQETLICYGKRVSLRELRSCQGKMEDSSLKLLNDTLLCGHKFPVDMAALRENPSEEEHNYSFLSDESNAAALGDRDRLCNHILNDPKLRRKFIKDVRGTTVIWNTAAMIKWLRSYARLNLFIIIQILMNTAGPARGTEVTGLTRTNTRCGILRGLHVVDAHIVLMRHYTKVRANGVDLRIPHSLNASLAAMIVSKEAVCHPFAILCADVLFPKSDEKIRALYHRYLFVNYDRLFDTQAISEEMKSWTGKHLGVQLGVLAWRHVHIAFNRPHAGDDMDLLRNQSTVEAAQAGHSDKVHNDIYGNTDRRNLGVPENLIARFLAGSVRWHHMLRLVPGE